VSDPFVVLTDPQQNLIVTTSKQELRSIEGGATTMSATASLSEGHSTALLTFRVNCEELTHSDHVSLVLRDADKVRRDQRYRKTASRSP
jgi:hypothetical protein